jgi:hypothetical protein
MQREHDAMPAEKGLNRVTPGTGDALRARRRDGPSRQVLPAAENAARGDAVFYRLLDVTVDPHIRSYLRSMLVRRR